MTALSIERKGGFATRLVDECNVILSPHEKKLLRRLAVGKSDRVIACEIGGTQQRIGVQRKRLIEKLHIQSQAQLVTFGGSVSGVACSTGKRRYI